MAINFRTRNRGATGYDRTRGATHPPRRAERPPAVEPLPPASTAVPPRRDWRAEVASLSGLNVIAGIWLIIAPWVLSYSNSDPKWNDVVFGAIIAILALVRMTGAFRASSLSVINALIGVWLFIAAFTIDRTGTAAWNDIILGVIVFLLAIGSASASEEHSTAPPVA